MSNQNGSILFECHIIICLISECNFRTSPNHKSSDTKIVLLILTRYLSLLMNQYFLEYDVRFSKFKKKFFIPISAIKFRNYKISRASKISIIFLQNVQLFKKDYFLNTNT